MDLKALTNLLKGGGGISNPVAGVASNLTSIAATFAGSGDLSVQTLGTFLASLVTAGNSAVTGVTGNITTLLPIAKASDRIQKKLEATQGQNLQGGVTPAFNNVFGPLTQSLSQMNSVSAALSPSVVANIMAGDLSQVSALTTLTGNAGTAITASSTASATAIADCTNTLKSYAFAKFVSMDQPAPVQSIVTAVMGSNTVPYESVKADVAVAATSTPAPARLPPAVKSPENPSTATDKYAYQDSGSFNTRPEAVNLAAIGYSDPVNCQQQFKEAYFAYVEPLSKTADDYFRNTVSPASDTFTAYKNSAYPNYAELKTAGTAAGASQASVDAYNNAKTSVTSSSQYQAYLSAVNTYNPMRDNIIRLRNQWHTWVLNKFATAHAGPPW